MKMGAQKYVRTRVYPYAPDSTAPLDTAKKVRQPGGAHSVRMQYICTVPVGYAAERLGRAVQCKCSKIRMQGGGGCKYEALCMGGVVQGRLHYHIRCPPSGHRGWHLRAANKRIQTCARMSDMSGMSICMDGMQQTACHGHV